MLPQPTICPCLACLANFSLSLELYHARMPPSRAPAFIPTVCHHGSNSTHWPCPLALTFLELLTYWLMSCAPGHTRLCLPFRRLVNFLKYTRQRADCQRWETQFHSGGEGEWTTLKQNCRGQIQSKAQALRKTAIKNTKSEFSSYKRPG